MLLLQEAGSPFTNRNEASHAKSNQFDTFHPNISIYILHTVLYIFPKALMREFVRQSSDFFSS